MRIGSRVGLTVKELLIVMAVVGLVFLVLSGWVGVGGYNKIKAAIWRYDVEGTVLAPPGQKMFGGENRETKFSVNLQTQAGPTIVNCTSTHCGSLIAGQKVRLSCFNETHLWEPNEEECRFDELLP